MNKVKVLLVALTLIGFTQVSIAAVVLTSEYSTNSWSSTPWSSQVSATDLINNGQSTLSSSSATTPVFGAGGINDGYSSYNNQSGENAFYYDNGSTFPAVATYNLDTSINTLGYDITSIESFMGWWENMLHQANQTYTIEVSTVGDEGYTLLTTVTYTPFDADTYGNAPNGYHYSHVEIDADTGILASGVDSIRFTFSAPEYGDITGVPGTVIREIDVYGNPTTVPEPASMIMFTIGSSLILLYRRRQNGPSLQ